MGLRLRVGQDGRAADTGSAAASARPVEVEILPAGGVRVRVPAPGGKSKWYACARAEEFGASWACRLVPEDAGDAHEGYVVSLHGTGWRCQCEKWKYTPNGEPCKHILAAVPVRAMFEAWKPEPWDVPAKPEPPPAPEPAPASLLERYAAKTGQDAEAIRRRIGEDEAARKAREWRGWNVGQAAADAGEEALPLPVEFRKALAAMKQEILDAVAGVMRGQQG